MRPMSDGMTPERLAELREARAEALRGVATYWEREVYPEDVFIPIPAADHVAITRAILATGHTRDAVSADVMRMAARALRYEADRIERGDADE